MNLLSLVDKLCGSWLDYRTNQALSKVSLEEEIEFLDIHANQKGIELFASHPMFASLAIECTDMLAKENAKNFLEMEVMPRLDRGTRAFVITVAFKDGEMPGHKAKRLEDEVTRLNAILAEFAPAYERKDGK